MDESTDTVALTKAEKMMLDYLLEKERKNGLKKELGGSQIENQSHRRGDNWTRPSVPDTSRAGPSGSRTKRPPEDRALVKAMDDLNRLSDHELTRLMRECDLESGENGTEATAGNFLAWYMTRTKFGPQAPTSLRMPPSEAREKNRPRQAQAKQVPRANSTPASSFCGRRPRNQRPDQEPSALQPYEDGQGRLVFSFMQDAVVKPSPPDQGQIDKIPAKEIIDHRRNPTAKFDNPLSRLRPETRADNGPSCSSDPSPRRQRGGRADKIVLDENIKLSRSERPPRVRTTIAAEEDEEDFDDDSLEGSDLEFAGLLEGDLAQMAKNRKKPKKRKEKMCLWDPEKPRPMPRRLRPRGNAPAFTKKDVQGSSVDAGDTIGNKTVLSCVESGKEEMSLSVIEE